MPLIVLEGIDGCGKSTQAALLADHLQSQGRTVVRLREPGCTPLGERLRTLLLDPTTDATPLAELFCFSAARAQLCQHVLPPLLASGAYVVMDRFWHSTIAYQVHGLGLDAHLVRSAVAMSIGAIRADAAFWVDTPLTIIRARTATRTSDRIELRSNDFFGRVRDGYQGLAHSGELIRIDGTQSKETIAATLQQHCPG
jgi:dTMP kinase